MTRRGTCALAALMLMGTALAVHAQHSSTPSNQHSYLGFDRNNYPGDAALPALRKSFRYTGYWLNNPPGEHGNSWTGKRALLKQRGFGFLILFNGRTYAELKNIDPSALGTADGKAALAAAAREGFPAHVLIFLDQEEGGRLLPEQAAYLFAWADAVRAGGARAGVYCSGIDVPDGNATISTAQNIVEREQAIAKKLSKDKSAAHLALWIANDQCPPSPGCTLANTTQLTAAFSPAVAASAVVWQYAQSPRRAQFSAACPANHAPDGNCYAPGVAPSANTFVDLNTANSPDPSETP
jgi:Rv2525c-like, glycoside hydrolase-like domain